MFVNDITHVCLFPRHLSHHPCGGVELGRRRSEDRPGGAPVVCGRDHLPTAILLPLADHSQVVWRVNDQIAVKNPLRKRLWKQLVQAKILAQSDNLAPDSPTRKKLLDYAVDVRSGDTTNREAHAARVYCQNWMIHPDAEVSEEHFRRTRDGAPPNPPTCALRSTSCTKPANHFKPLPTN